MLARRDSNESKPANFLYIDHSLAISLTHDLADGSFVLDPELACHSSLLYRKGLTLQEKA